MKNAPNKKLEQSKARKAAQRCGVYPGMGRSRIFRDHKHHANKYGCRGKLVE